MLKGGHDGGTSSAERGFANPIQSLGGVDSYVDESANWNHIDVSDFH